MILTNKQVKNHRFKKTDGVKHKNRNWGEFEILECVDCKLRVRLNEKRGEYKCYDYKECKSNGKMCGM